MRASSCAALGVLALVLAQIVGVLAWRQRPAAANAELIGEEQRLGSVFVELPPGEFAGTLLLGGLRGLVTDLLWLRSLRAREEGRYYESLALYQLISQVQPRFEQAWQHMAHDMAYNIGFDMDSEEDKWAWFLAGLDALRSGSLRNPRSARLLRSFAWTFHHKGETFLDRVPRHDWSGLLNDVLAAFGEREDLVAHGVVQARRPPDGSEQLELRRLGGAVELGASFAVLASDGRFAGFAELVAVEGDTLRLQTQGRLSEVGDLSAVESLSNYAAAARLYRAYIAHSLRLGQVPMGYARRLVPLGMELDGNRLRNRGNHLAALRAWITALEDWQQALAWARDPLMRQDAGEIARAESSYERNEGALRRRAAGLAQLLASEDELGRAVAEAIESRRFDAARALLAGPGWRESLGSAGTVRWYDE